MTKLAAASDRPAFALERYFSGRTRAWGVVQDRFGRLRRQFVVEMTGSLDGDELTLDEHFSYDDGSTSERIWHVRKTGPTSYEGEADDVVGKAIGRADGTMVTWRYRLRLPIGKRIWTLSFHDVMYLQPDGVMINRALMRKLGLRLGELTIVFQRIEDPAPDQSLGTSRRVIAKASG